MFNVSFVGVVVGQGGKTTTHYLSVHRTHPLTHSLTVTHSLSLSHCQSVTVTHSVRSLTHSLSRSFTVDGSLTHSLTHKGNVCSLLAHSLTHSLTQPLTH